MSTASLPDYAELADALRALETGLEPSELHGSLCGWLAGGGLHDRSGWFAAGADSSGSAITAANQPLRS